MLVSIIDERYEITYRDSESPEGTQHLQNLKRIATGWTVVEFFVLNGRCDL